jgi:hypothetical protein
MRTCLKATRAIGEARETTEAVVAGVMVAADSAVNAVMEEEVVVVSAERGPVARRAVTADHPTDLLAVGPVNAAMTALVLVGTDEAAEIVVDSGDAMTAIADRVSRPRQPSLG